MTSKLSVRSNTSHMLNELLDNPDLPALVPELSAPGLQALVEHLGREDAQLLLVHASAEQITDLIESDAWVRPDTGLEEQFCAATMLEWIELWRDLGVDYLTRRLREMGSELLARTLDDYVVVVDSQEVGVSGWADTLGRFCVMPKNDDQWQDVWQIIADVWSEDQEFVEEALAYVCQRRSLTIEKTYITRNENLAPDVDAARDRHRRERGYITPQSATAFLNHARRESLATLIMEQAYDPFTRTQLRRLEATLPEAGADPHTTGALDSLLADIEQRQRLRLTAPVSQGDWQSDFLAAQLRRLSQASPRELVQRERELLYLTNVVLEGLPAISHKADEHDAMHCVRQCCNLGLLHCLFNTAWASEDEMLSELLEQEPGLIRLFLIGFRLSLEVRDRSLAAFCAALASDRAQRALHDEPELRHTIAQWLARHATGDAIAALTPKQVGQMLDSLLLVTDHEASEALRHLVLALPRFPLALCSDTRNRSIYVSQQARLIATLADLKAIALFLQDLEQRLFA